MTSSDYRKQARENLAGRWGKIAFISFIYLLVNGLISAIVNHYSESSLGSILSIAQIVINVPLSYGLTITFLKIKRKEAVEFSDIFTEGFNNFTRAWCIVGRRTLALIVPFIITVVSVIVLIIGVVVLALSNKSSIYSKNYSSRNYYSSPYSSSYDTSISSNDILEDARRELDSIERGYSDYYHPEQNSSSTGLLAVGLILIFVGFIGITVGSILLYVKSLYYVQAELLSYDNPNLTAKELVQESKKIMTNKRSSYFTLNLSFIGWAILAAFTLGIGYIWLLPYIQIANVFFYESLINKDTNNNAENTVNEN